jgi:hypothetical protein
MYSKILLIWLAWGRAGFKLLIIPDNQTVCILIQILTGNFLLLPLYLSCTTNHRSISFGYLLIHLFRFIRFLYCVFWRPHSWRSGWSRRGGSGNTTVVDVWTFLEASLNLFEHVPEIGLFHWGSFFLTKSKIPSLGTTPLKCWVIRSSKL